MARRTRRGIAVESMGNDVVIDMPAAPGWASKAQHAYVVRLPGLQAR
ncbi:MAG: hypothetical protein JNL98_34910 [Bryobacterales bacterium]|nr:hypothetical protein [Bryobacterales bacterium]